MVGGGACGTFIDGDEGTAAILAVDGGKTGLDMVAGGEGAGGKPRGDIGYGHEH